MANFPRNDDIWKHIRFGEPVSARTFPDREAARAYVISGLDTAHELIRARIHDDRVHRLVEKDSCDLAVLVTDQIHRLRNSLAAPPHMGRTAAVRELLRLGDRARAAHNECICHICLRYLVKALLLCAVMVGFAILPIKLGPVTFVLWRSWFDCVEERTAKLLLKQANVAEIWRAATTVAGICQLLD